MILTKLLKPLLSLVIVMSHDRLSKFNERLELSKFKYVTVSISSSRLKMTY